MSPRHAGAKKTRFTLWVPDDTLRDLKRLQKLTGKESVAEVIRESIMVYSDLLKARGEGVDLFYQDSKSGESGRIWLLPGPPPMRSKSK
jgi:hypothetical protein